MVLSMFKLTGSSNTPAPNNDANIIRSALGAYSQHSRDTWFFTDPRFLQGVFVGILMFYIMLYYTRRYKNKVNTVGSNDSFAYVTTPNQMPYRETYEGQMQR
ncbi:hypothetical protein, conserved [Plasmodium gonderi]|uniref:Uncharacterized protein n=1 Tax=Plasmodium gonderi TaxID=77519 RepID=A0A1Y1J8M9_PLAGO|nr:hypothetical protein, conserved [Plasmodium gonderi]GAW78866.1 hypothetical protein, conserved [Plasmodium gonderi]